MFKSNINEKLMSLIDYWKKGKIISNKKVIEAFKKIDRRIFVPEELKEQAYDDIPLPIGFGATISQPTTIAIMTQALELKKGMKVLEIGTGSGYQSAIISSIIGRKGEVISIEIVPELASLAKKNLKKAGITNVEVINADGSKGYEKEAPYDRIIITAASPEIPRHLLKQLKKKGIIVVPVGELFSQRMIKMKKNDKVKIEDLGPFSFVPLKGKKGWGN